MSGVETPVIRRSSVPFNDLFLVVLPVLAILLVLHAGAGRATAPLERRYAGLRPRPVCIET